jgi:hypothetical protein
MRAAQGANGAWMVNSTVENIFNGLFRAPVNEKIPALSSI